MDDKFPNRYSSLTSNSQNNQLSDFKYILSNQHSRQFHIIDSPDLIFELAQYKFDKGQSFKTNNQSQKFTNKKLYRHKSQQQSIEKDFFSKNIKFPDHNSFYHSNKKFKPPRSSLNEDTYETNSIHQNPQAKKKQFNTKDKSYTNKGKPKQHSLKIIFKNLQEKQNLHAKILNAPRPLTSNTTNLKTVPSTESDSKPSWKKMFERKKYSDIKMKLETLIKNVESCEDFNFSEVFEYEQLILKDYLNSVVIELKKQCVEKGQLIQMIWNTFFVLIEKIMNILISNKKISQKTQIQEQINIHQGYQDMCVYQANKIMELGKKYNQSKNVIDRLIYELRYKRKEAKKLYKSLAICNQKINEYKIQHIDLQNEHIDLLIESQKMEKDKATEILKRKIEINKEKFMKLRVGMKKQKIKEKIEKQILFQKIDPEEQEIFKKELFEKINSFKHKNKKTSTEQKQQSHFIEEFIERFSNKNIEQNDAGGQIEIHTISRRPQKMSTAINTDINPKGKNEFTYTATQTTISDKLQFSMIDHRSTQTTGFQKMKKFESIQVQADGDQMKIVLTKAKMMAYKTMDLSFYFDLKRRDDKIKQQIIRKSQFSNFKQSKGNQSISQISSDQSQDAPKETIKKGLSKEDQSFKKDKKSGVFNKTLPSYANVKIRDSKDLNGKYGNSSKMKKKRSSQIPQVFQSGTQSQFKRQQNLPKKRTFQSPSSFERSQNRASVCPSSIDSVIENIPMTEEKQKFIENYIMSKDQQFQILDDNAIFDTFKNHVSRQNKKKHLFFEFHKNKGTIYSKILQTNNQSLSYRQSEGQEQFLNPKEPRQSFQKLKQTHKQFQRSIQNTHGRNRSSIDGIQNIAELQAEKESLRNAHFLNNIIEFTIKKSMIKKRIDTSNFQACKQKSQFASITQKLDPFMLDVQFLVNQGSIKKRKQKSINIKAANKFLMMTYSRSIDKIYRNNAILQNLIKPLFESFEVIYGALKPNEIYRKMVTFISDIFSVKDNENFKQFIFFLGMDKTNIYSAYLTTFDVCLHLKLLEKLNIGGKISYEIESIFTSKSKVNSELVNILESQKISPQVIMIVSGKMKVLLEKLENFVRENMQSTEEQSKINLFKVSKMIVEEVIKLRVQSMKKLESYMTGSQLIIQTAIKDIQKIKNDLINVDPIQKIVDCCRISTSKKLYFSKYIEQLCSKSQNSPSSKKLIKRSELGVLLIRIGLVNFDELEERIRYIDQKTTVKDKEIQMGTGGTEIHNFSRNIQKLMIVEAQTNFILENILGDMMITYQIGLIKSLQNKKN